VQVQVHERAGLGFAAALRSILRQDPDVVLVGEVRDRETAAVAAQAALTGHLVLATLHTLDAIGAVARLADLGVEPFRLAAALRGVVAQRLVRALCPACRVRVPPGWRDARLAGHAPEGEPVWATSRTGLAPGGAACARCAGAGYRGRIAVPEVLVADAALADQVARGASAASLASAARAAGMTTLWANGVDRVRAGATTVDELLRVVEPPAAPARSADGSAVGAPGASTALAASRRPLPDLDAHFELA
jgi:type II secretory ATPase GspE/PulE/Tfp pilus assembly ATPase PilB-like protein